tara:strand:- start:209 stop:460 length:252 start_codon:yes stop_codon:yes gene_type:complete
MVKVFNKIFDFVKWWIIGIPTILLGYWGLTTVVVEAYNRPLSEHFLWFFLKYPFLIFLTCLCLAIIIFGIFCLITSFSSKHRK